MVVAPVVACAKLIIEAGLHERQWLLDIDAAQCPLLAQSGHHTVEFQCPLLGGGVKRTFRPRRFCGLMGPLSRLKTEPKMGHPHFQNVGLKLNAALDCEAAHSVVTGIRHWYQVIRQAVKFFHLLCCFERLSVSPFGRAICVQNRERVRFLAGYRQSLLPGRPFRQLF